MAPAYLVNARFLTRRPTGVDRFARELLSAVCVREKDIDLGRGVAPRKGEVAGSIPPGMNVDREGMFTGHIWEQLSLPVLSRDSFLINLCNTAPVRVTEQLVVLHDAGVAAIADSYGVRFRLWYGLMIRALVRRARVVTTVSQFSAAELTQHFGRPRGGYHILSESGEHILRTPRDDSVLTRLGVQGKPFLLTVGSLAPHKNLERVRAAVDHLRNPNIMLVATGGKSAKIFAPRAVPFSRIVMSGYLNDGELRALYESAIGLVFPSLYEGFGLPCLEAMHCGCPVIAAARGALPEVCGNAALYCDPLDVADIARKIDMLLSSNDLRVGLIKAGLERVALYTWQAAAQSLSDILATH